MKYRLKFTLEKDADFAAIKKEGYGGVIFSQKYANAADIERARKCRLKTFVHLGSLSRAPVKYIESGGTVDGEMRYVSVSSVKKALKTEADGLIIPAPCGTGLLWDDAFPDEYKRFCGRDLYDELPLLFDEEIKRADVRIWYYTRAAEKVFREYVLPVSECVKKAGKTVCFDLGNMERSDYGIRKMMLPRLFDRAKIPTVREENGERQFISAKHNSGAKTLFVTAISGIMEMYVWGKAYSKVESEFSLAVCEEAYYRNTLSKCGIKAYMVDDTELCQMRLGTLKKFDDVLLAKGCILAADKKEKLLKAGVKIDGEELLRKLDSVN